MNIKKRLADFIPALRGPEWYDPPYVYTKTESPNYEPLGAHWPHKTDVDTREKAMENLVWMRGEITRWHRSCAFVNDISTPFDWELEMAEGVWVILEKQLDDINASSISSILVSFIARLAPTARAIVRDYTAGNELQAVVCFAIAEACDKAEQLCEEETDKATVRKVSAKMKYTLLSRRFTNAGRILPWSDHEMRTFILEVNEGKNSGA